MPKFASILLTFVLVASAASSQPITNSGPSFPQIERVNKIVQAFQAKYQIPGISLAISHNNKLVYAVASGYSDKEAEKPLSLDDRMRIASCTKPLTSIAILLLSERKQLRLSDPVFGPQSLLGPEYREPSFEGAKVRLTVEQLLSHTGGGWGNERDDPMFVYTGLDGKDLINKVLDQRSLEYKPGTKYLYSNFGYSILGRVIEKVSGVSYEEFVKSNVLEPLGIHGMRIGAPNSAADEVKYYSNEGFDPTRLSPAHMDSHGGWIANPIELLKVLSAIDRFPNGKPLLQGSTIAVMTKPPLSSSNYALGLSVNRSNNWWHTGSLPGTSSEIGRTASGFCWAILVNTRPGSARSAEFGRDLDQLFWNIHESVRQWPEGEPLLP